MRESKSVSITFGLISVALLTIILSTPAYAELFRCPKDFKTFQAQIQTEEKRASQEADKSPKLVFEKGEIGELITLLAPDRLEDASPFIGVALRCWTHYYEFSESLKKVKSAKRNAKKRSEMLRKWKTCTKEFYPNDTIATHIASCHDSFSR